MSKGHRRVPLLSPPQAPRRQSRNATRSSSVSHDAYTGRKGTVVAGLSQTSADRAAALRQVKPAAADSKLLARQGQQGQKQPRST